MGLHFPPQNCRFVWEDLDPLSNTLFPWPIQVRIPNGISIASAIFAGLTIVTHRPTDRRTDHATPSVAILYDAD